MFALAFLPGHVVAEAFVFVTPLSLRLASRLVVVAPCCCIASCACIGIVSQGLVKPCISELSVLPQSEACLVGRQKGVKDGFPGRDL